MLSNVHAMAHITGGGLPGNLNRALPATFDAVVDTTSWHDPERVRAVAAGRRRRSRDEMFRTFNMGVGMVVIVAESDAAEP